jgi:hypothetical protein
VVRAMDESSAAGTTQVIAHVRPDVAPPVVPPASAHGCLICVLLLPDAVTPFIYNTIAGAHGAFGVSFFLTAISPTKAKGTCAVPRRCSHSC